MKVTGPLFKWFGSKWQASKHYPPPQGDEVIEPFAGGAGYSLRHSHLQVTIAESDPHVGPLWKWLISEATESDILAIPVGLPVGTDIRTLGLTLGQSLLLKSWQRTNSTGNCWTVSPWGDKPGQWTLNTRARVAAEFHAVRHWKFVSDGLTLLEGGADRSATWFIDPPYENNYKYSGWNVDYSTLAGLVKGLQGHVIVCEATCPKTGKFPSWLPFEDFRSTVTSRRKSTQNHHSRELIYTKSR
jgi:site-specific DNA-adenine methylase